MSTFWLKKMSFLYFYVRRKYPGTLPTSRNTNLLKGVLVCFYVPSINKSTGYCCISFCLKSVPPNSSCFVSTSYTSITLNLCV